VPTVNGRLSYRHIGECSHPANTKYANVSPSDNTRYILAFQIRPLSDLLFKSLTEAFSRLTGDMPFLLCAKTTKTSEQDYTISGNVFIFSNKRTWQISCKSEISRHVESINERRLWRDQQNESIVSANWQTARQYLRQNADIRVYFRLLRSGEVFFSNPRFRDKELENNSLAYANSKGHDFRSWIANQAYFFLRDLCHRHQHHDAYSDTILILQDRTTLMPRRWRLNIIYSLHFALIRAKRHSEVTSLAQALGLLSYAKSFEKICAKDPDWKDSKYNYNELTGSIEARLKELELQNAQQDRISAKNRNRNSSFLTFIAIVMGILAILVQPSIEAHTAPPLLETISLKASILFIPITLWLFIAYLLYLVVSMPSPAGSSNWFQKFRQDILEISLANILFSKGTNLLIGTLLLFITLVAERNFIFTIVESIMRLVSSVQ